MYMGNPMQTANQALPAQPVTQPTFSIPDLVGAIVEAGKQGAFK